VAEEPDPDPLTAFISRSLRADVRDVREELLPGTAEAEISRVTFTQAGTSRSLVVKRVPKDRSVEVMLLPHLARKTERVPIVYARGIPPAAVAGRPWLLLEDLTDGSAAADLDAIVDAKLAVERAVAADAPALVALGVPRMDRRGALAEWPEVLVHGALVRANAVLADRGVVLIEWGHAALGAGLVDVVRLARDAGAPARALAEHYATASGQVLSDAALDAAIEAV
jgi:hypothetical protein